VLQHQLGSSETPVKLTASELIIVVQSFKSLLTTSSRLI